MFSITVCIGAKTSSYTLDVYWKILKKKEGEVGEFNNAWQPAIESAVRVTQEIPDLKKYIENS